MPFIIVSLNGKFDIKHFKFFLKIIAPKTHKNDCILYVSQ